MADNNIPDEARRDALLATIRHLSADERQWLFGVFALEFSGVMLLDQDLDSLAVRRELAAASVAALGDFWDNEVDSEWQDFQP